tara:strand:- start:1514 stop:1729 length:216 start_codon:yes stop_codon:yes gene_type:complete
MKKDEIIKELTEILLLDGEINEDSKINEIDSMGSLLLAQFFSENFNISVNKKQIENFKEIGDIIIFIDLNK